MLPWYINEDIPFTLLPHIYLCFQLKLIFNQIYCIKTTLPSTWLGWYNSIPWLMNPNYSSMDFFRKNGADLHLHMPLFAGETKYFSINYLCQYWLNQNNSIKYILTKQQNCKLLSASTYLYFNKFLWGGDVPKSILYQIDT